MTNQGHLAIFGLIPGLAPGHDEDARRWPKGDQTDRTTIPTAGARNQCYGYVTTPENGTDELLSRGPGPSPGRQHIWTNELLPRAPLWDRALSVFAIVTTCILAGVALVVIVAALGLLAISHISDKTNINLNLPDLSAAPSNYGLNAVVSGDGTRLFVTEPASNRLAVVSVKTGVVLATVPTGTGPAGLALSPSGNQVWVVNSLFNPTEPLPSPSDRLGLVTVISTATDKVLGTVQGAVAATLGVAFPPNGRHAYLTANGIGSPPNVGEGVLVIDTRTLKVMGALTPAAVSPTRELPGSSPQVTWSPTSVAVTPNGKQVWVSSQSVQSPSSPGSVYVFSTATDTELAEIAVGEGSFFMTLSSDGRYAYVADKESCDVREIDTQTFRVVSVVQTLPKYGCPYGIAATATDGVVVTATGSDHTLNLGNHG